MSDLNKISEFSVSELARVTVLLDRRRNNGVIRMSPRVIQTACGYLYPTVGGCRCAVSPKCVSGREDAPKELSEALARHTRGSTLCPSPPICFRARGCAKGALRSQGVLYLGLRFVDSAHSVSGRKGSPKELSEAMARLTWGSALWTLPQSVSGQEGARQKSPQKS